MTRAFVDYYSENNISPVRQDLGDMSRHFTRRGALYHALGIFPAFVRDRDVLEFGPGSGDNSLHTASLGPRRYVLVDANPTGLAHTRERFAALADMQGRYDVVESLIERFATDERFDLVLAEGLLPGQHDPSGLTRHIGSFVRPGGVLVVTCFDSASSVVEVCGRLLASRIAPASLPIAERVERLRPVFAPRLQTLGGMTRSIDDWILDNITHPITGNCFAIDDAVAACDDAFDVGGSSPRFMTDWRWYKTIVAEPRGFNERAVESYYANILNFLDYRVELPPHDAALGRRIRQLADEVYTIQLGIYRGDTTAPAQAVGPLREMAGLAAEVSPLTARSLARAADEVEDGEPRPLEGPVAHFGRGQQYLSFVRR